MIYVIKYHDDPLPIEQACLWFTATQDKHRAEYELSKRHRADIVLLAQYSDALKAYECFAHDFGITDEALLEPQRRFIAELFDKKLSEVDADIHALLS